jgi:hypothetical protein
VPVVLSLVNILARFMSVTIRGQASYWSVIQERKASDQHLIASIVTSSTENSHVNWVFGTNTVGELTFGIQ